MTWIKTIPPQEAGGELKAIYDASHKLYGFIPNVRRSLSLDPTALRAYTQLSGAVYHGGELPAEEREMIAVVVSVANHCHY